jgi:hypothetical protein
LGTPIREAAVTFPAHAPYDIPMTLLGAALMADVLVKFAPQP